MERSILKGLQNSIIKKDLEVGFAGISTDTRKISAGDFYIPLKGANFDGEQFIDVAVDSGASGFITTNPEVADKFLNDERVKFIAIVPDTKISYMELAGKRLEEKKFKVVGITGSSGKTTTKEMVYAVLSAGFKVHKTALNHNNEIGFCQTVFEAPDDSEIVIIEMGMRGLGEIELISKYAKPDAAIVTNVGTAHIGRLGSRENIARAKCEISGFIKPDGIFIAHDDVLIKSAVLFGGEKKYYSIGDVEVLCREVGFTKFRYGEDIYELPIEGNHNVENALSAINVGSFFGMPPDRIAEGLKNFQSIENRWNIERVAGFEIINDCYNANPESMKATISTVLEMYKNPTLILGDMGELGEDAAKYHAEVGSFLNSHPKLTKETLVITVGELAENISSMIKNCQKIALKDSSQVVNYILKNSDIGNILFFKASRSMKFEEIINEIKGEV